MLSDFIVSFINILTDNQVAGLPLLVWAVIPCIIGAVVLFVKGSNE